MKTPEEIKAGLRCHTVQWHAGECPDHEPGCKGCPYENDYHDPDELMADALELIEELEKKVPKWISVEERLPDNDDYYLTYTTEYTCEVYRYDGDGEWVTAWDDTANHDITHWMPLPVPPEEEV